MVVLLVYLGWCGLMYVYQDALVFPADLAPQIAASVPGDVEVIEIETGGGGAVPAWFYPATGADADEPGPAVLYFHGNAEIIDEQDRVAAMWGKLGASLMLVEFRGYGRAADAGPPSQHALVADGVRFFDLLRERPEVDPDRIIVHGYSIGGGVAAQVAARRKPAALILEASFKSLASFSWGYGVPPVLARHPFRTDKVLPVLDVPIFISHGSRDMIVPVHHGRWLHALAAGSVYVELDCGHLDMPGDRRHDPYRERIRTFLVDNGILSR